MPAAPTPAVSTSALSSCAATDAVLAARRRFFSGAPVAEDALAQPILRSWTRCAARGLGPQSRSRMEPLTDGEFAARRERHEALRRRCRPELEALHAAARAADSIVILTDPSGLVLDTVGSADFADRAAKVALRPGVSWSEAETGTNAIGTALVERRPVEVRGAEHYAEANGILSCAAAPIHDPFGELVGLLDLSGPASVPHLHALALVELAAGQVEHRMFEGAFPDHSLVRFHADPSFLGTAREGILVFEEYRLVAANRPGLALLGLGWDALGAKRFGDLFEGSLGKAGEERRVRTRRGDVAMRLERQGLPVRTIAPRAAPAVERPAAPVPAQPPVQTGPRFDAATERDLGRAVRLMEAGVPVLIQGETGVGKEVFARQIHRRGNRGAKAFAAVNCAALPEGLIESELFGYEEGAFTGARRAGFKGLFREADGGVLFLDEIGDMPLSLQSRLLRVLQEREVTPLGGGRPVAVDFALVCASHRDLKQRVEEGAFRADLYFRIAQYTVTLPALRTLADREALVDRLWAELTGACPDAPSLSAECRAALAGHGWPGNFRQLVGVLRVLQALAEPGEVLGVEALPADVRSAPLEWRGAGRPAEIMPAGAEAGDSVSRELGARDLESRDLGAVTRAAMDSALAASGGNVSQAARRLGIHRSTLHRHLASRGSRGGH
ncbi:sigma-54-dependent Fis family transcriptional regulator [Xanthobacter oligotrophicus]|uniref:sigma-54-dependent Fis family transcriptional regulator n=1 Tax=Xanthobacter oligotrophicus TaxID=2607286 RepID=UPI00165D348A|nr:sigma-54-dependent Fis family transcriptional regulator [Xanthobacter oligotrophicus]MCG5235476.1 sigma-54-dependent Fis family transcriptional regulator [Xanthobacter oligotrophicus]